MLRQVQKLPAAKLGSVIHVQWGDFESSRYDGTYRATLLRYTVMTRLVIGFMSGSTTTTPNTLCKPSPIGDSTTHSSTTIEYVASHKTFRHRSLVKCSPVLPAKSHSLSTVSYIQQSSFTSMRLDAFLSVVCLILTFSHVRASGTNLDTRELGVIDIPACGVSGRLHCPALLTTLHRLTALYLQSPQATAP
jgi:hypothetical protein